MKKLLLLIFLLVGCARQNNEVTEIEYKQGLLMDVYGERSDNILVYIHGGAWSKGSRKNLLSGDRDLIVDQLLEEEFMIISIDYSYANETSMDQTLQDCVDAVNFIKEEYSPNYLGLWGTSAGAHLSLLTTQHTYVDFIIDFYGPTDLSEFDGLIGYSVDYEKHNPISYKEYPRMLIVHGTADKVVPIEQSIKLYEQIDSEMITVEGEKHSLLTKELSEENRNLIIDGFIKFVMEGLQ